MSLKAVIVLMSLFFCILVLGAFASAAVPAVPTNVNITHLPNNQVRIGWTDNANDETGYTLYRGTYLTSTQTISWSVDATLSAGVTSFTVPISPTGTIRYFKVRAYNADGESADSLIVIGIAGPFRAEVAIGSLILAPTPVYSWNCGSARCHNYVANTLVSFTKSSGIWGGDCVLTNGDLCVLTMDRDREMSAGTSAPPSAPTDFTARFGATQGELRFDWTDTSSTEREFRIHFSRTNVTWNVLTNTSANTQSITLTNPMLANIPYFFKLRAYSPDGVSSESEIVSLTRTELCQESTQAFCARLGKNCGGVTGTDICSISRTVNCGSCGPGETCPSATNVCLRITQCSAADNAQACAGKNCGSVYNECNELVSCGSLTCSGAGQTCGGGGRPNVCGDVVTDRLLPGLALLQLLTPQPFWISVLSGTAEIKGVSLSSLAAHERTYIFTAFFGTATPASGSVASKIVGDLNYTLLYEQRASGDELVVYYSSISTNSSPFPVSFIAPFLKRGVLLHRAANRCLNGIVEGDEECDLQSSTLLANHPACGQSTTQAIGPFVGTRDAFGSCTVACMCAEDSFTITPEAVVAASPAGNECSTDNDCAVLGQRCLSGICVEKTYCGDGIVQTLNDNGQAEQCDYAAPTPYLACGTSDVGQCRMGTTICTRDCTYSPLCIGQVLPDIKETCGDGIDNNCNGARDEGCSCEIGTQQLCGSGVGQCRKGISSCIADTTGQGAWGVCENEVTPADEICDGIDNNCNGLVDEGVRDREDRCGSSVLPEICDGIDNNDNGAIDEGNVCPDKSRAFCIDSDPANDFFVRGVVVQQGNPYYDTCEESGASVRQYFCSLGRLQTFIKRCPLGSRCSLGACSQSAQSTRSCIDSDPSDSLSIAGAVTHQNGAYYDSCEEGGSSVRQYSCQGTTLAKAVTRCSPETFCLEGACVAVEIDTLSFSPSEICKEWCVGRICYAHSCSSGQAHFFRKPLSNE